LFFSKFFIKICYFGGQFLKKKFFIYFSQKLDEKPKHTYRAWPKNKKSGSILSFIPLTADFSELTPLFTQAECIAIVTCLFALVENRVNLHEEALHAGVGLEELTAVEVDQVIREATHLAARAIGRLLAELCGRAVGR